MTNTNKLLQAIYDGIYEKLGNNVVNMDFSKLGNTVTDHFVICDAQSDRQVKAIADSVEEFAFKQAGEKVVHVEGTDNSQWVLLDFTDVIVHIFQTEYRPFYNLEALWADAEISHIPVPQSPISRLNEKN